MNWNYSGRDAEESSLRKVLAHRACCFETDTILTGNGVDNPASYGTFPRLLGRYVRELKLLSLAEAVRRMTALVAASTRKYSSSIPKVKAQAWSAIAAAARAKRDELLARYRATHAELRPSIAVVDYAHKPEALAACLDALRPFATVADLHMAMFNAVRAQTLVNEKTAALQAKSPEVIAALADFYNSLNPLQQQKVRDYMEGRGHWFSRG